MDNGRGFGAALRAQRRDRRLSLQEVSAATGISASFLSLVENDKSDITLGRLVKLAAFYDVHVSDLLPSGAGREPNVIRGADRKHVSSPSEGIDVYLLGPDSERRMLPLYVRFAPGGQPAEMSEHEGEEYVHVLSGTISFEMEAQETVVLEPGDGAYYRADRPHRISAVGPDPAEVFIVASPPHL